jgi:valyl-tRNA synthetase
VLETGWEIITRWVSRMVMFGIYNTGKSPFKDVYLHGMVRAVDGKKMSKSLGNQEDPDKYLQEYGADALRMGLISGTANGKDFAFPKDKVVAYRNFANKIWNMSRFFLMEYDKLKESTGIELESYSHERYATLPTSDKKIIDGLTALTKSVDENLAKYRFADAAEGIYHFMWEELASDYLEALKLREDKNVALSVFRHVFLNCLKLLHPFMPFITEEIWSNMPGKTGTLLIASTWPKL